MEVELTDQEAGFLIQMLDKTNVQGVPSKMMVLQIMTKIGEAANVGTPGQQSGRESLELPVEPTPSNEADSLDDL